MKPFEEVFLFMKPIWLKIENFKSYGNKDNQIDFRGINIACISGNNGHGKSSIAEALTWCLFGRFESTQGREKFKNIEYINHGKDYMAVTFEFEIDNTIYKIERRLDKKTGNSKVEIYNKAPNGQYIPFSESGKRKKDQIIEKILKLNYKTFLNSVYLSQKRTEDFLIASPKERKEILSQILNLGVYDEIFEIAKEEKKELLISKTVLEKEISQIEMIVSERETILNNLKELNNKKEEIERQINDIKVFREELLNTEKELLEQIRQTESNISEIERLNKELNDINNRINQLNIKIEEINQRYLSNELYIQGEMQKLDGIKLRYENMLNKSNEYNELIKQYERMIGNINLIEANKRNAEKRIAEINKQLMDKENENSENMIKLKTLEENLGQIIKQKEEIDHLRKIYESKKHEYSQLELRKKQLDDEIKTLRENYILFKNNKLSECPKCKRKLGPEDFEHIITEITNEGKEKANEQNEIKSKIDYLLKYLTDLDIKISKESDINKNITMLSSQIGKIKGLIDKNVNDIKILLQQKLEFEKQIDEIFIKQNELQKELSYIKKKMADINFNQDEFEKIKLDLKTFEKLTENYNLILNKKNEKIIYEENLKELKVNREKLSKQIEGIDLSKQKMNLNILREKQKSINEQYNSKNQQYEEKQVLLLDVLKQLGSCEEKIRQIEELIQKNAKLDIDLAETKRNIEILDIIIDLTNINGIKSEIIANTLPELEQEANNILKTLTGGNFTVWFETQKESSKGYLEETLQIKVQDSYGERDYELFSGGELFRINFAIRIALSKILLKRSGARIRMLILDEGFGSQDEFGRQVMVECLNSIREYFDVILVITHIEDFKDKFDRIILVEKDMEGSHINVV